MPPEASTTARVERWMPVGEAAAPVARDEPGDVVALGAKLLGDIAFEHADRGRAPDGRDERRHDRRARHVAADAHDAALRMRRLARELERAVEVAVEGDAVAEEVVDALGRLGRHAARHPLVDEPGAGGDRVGDVAFDRVAGADRGGDPALRPGGGGAFADRRAGDDGDRAGARASARRRGRRARRRR